MLDFCRRRGVALALLMTFTPQIAWSDDGQLSEASAELLEAKRKIDLYSHIWFTVEDNVLRATIASFGKKKEALIAEAFSERREAREENSEPFRKLEMTARVEKMRDTGVPEVVIQKLLAQQKTLLPKESEYPRLRVEYRAAELEADRRFATQISEILLPKEQAKLFEKAALTDAFLYHPCGVDYLQLTEQQREQLEQQLKLRATLAEKRMKKASDVVYEKGKAIVRGVPTSDKELAARFKAFAILTPEQLTEFLRLNRSISDNQEWSDWVEKMPDKTKGIARKYLVF